MGSYRGRNPMTGTTMELLAAGLFLLASHYGIASTSLRGALASRMGEGLYRALFSLIALAALVWLVVAFNRAPIGPFLWDLGRAGAVVPVVLMPVALLLVIGGLSPANPTNAGSEKRLEDPDPATGALRITRHPIQWGIGLWAVGHLVANGELNAVILFGTLAVLSLFGTLLLDHRYRRDKGALYAPFELSTSNLPLLAIVQGRQSLGTAFQEIGIIRIAATVLLYGLLLHFHGWIFGVPAFPM